MNNTVSKGKEIKIPGPDHPITISPAEGKVRVAVAGRTVAESTRALRLEEKGYQPVYYLPRDDADMSLPAQTTPYKYCPYKAIAATTAFPSAVLDRRMPCGRMRDRMRQSPEFASTLRFIPHGSMQSRLSLKHVQSLNAG